MDKSMIAGIRGLP